MIQLELFRIKLKQEQSVSNFIPVYNYGSNDTNESLESPKCVLEQVKQETVKSAPEQTKQGILESAPEQKQLIDKRASDNTSKELESPKCVLEQVKQETLKSAPEQTKQEILESAPEQKQLIDKQASDNTSKELESPKYVLEQVKQETLKSAPEKTKQEILESAPEQKQLINHWVEEYFPSNRKRYKYFRYCWMVGRKINHIHIRGGNAATPLARCRKEYIQRQILTGSSPDEILQIIKNQFK